VVQVVEGLPSKCEALSSNPVAPKTDKFKGVITHMVECLLCKCEVLSSDPSPHQKNQKTNVRNYLKPEAGGSHL
jgi:hypothetical protein